MYGAPLGWQPPGKPQDWRRPTPKSGEPEFDNVDNPGQWSDFTFQAKYKADKSLLISITVCLQEQLQCP